MKSEVFSVSKTPFTYAIKDMEKRANYLRVEENARIISVCWVSEFEQWHLFYEPNRSDSVITRGGVVI